jgi:hypothetical protein
MVEQAAGLFKSDSFGCRKPTDYKSQGKFGIPQK